MNKYAIIDLETTGHAAANKDKIIEVGIVTIKNNKISDEFSTLLNPNQPIPSFISKLTGIHDDDVYQAPRFEEVASDITNMIEGCYIIAHNVPFDVGFLNEELAAIGENRVTNPVMDTVELARVLYPQAPGFKLGQLAEYLQIQHDDPHRALSDAYVTADLFLKMLQKIEKLPAETIEHLLTLEPRLKSDLYQLLKDRSDELAFSIQERTDIETFQGLAFKKIPDDTTDKKTLSISFGEYLDDLYEINGRMHQQMAHYERRAGQREMSEVIYDAFTGGKHALIEAETGTGKSVAYLLTTIYEAVRLNKRIIISTYTTQLQSQLLEEEIPFIQKVVPFPFNVALLKGRQHYISLEKFAHELSNSEQDNYDITLTKAMILVWLSETETGDIDEIQLPSSGYLFYKKISSDAEGAIDPQSPWFYHSYYQKAKNKAQRAHLIITNHALLCTDIFNDYQFLPTYDMAIIDEAHHLEETASKHYGLKLDYMSIQYVLNQIGTVEENGWLGKFIRDHAVSLENNIMSKWNERYGNVKYELDDLFQMLFSYVIQRKSEKAISDVGRIQYRFMRSEEDPRIWETIKEMVNRFIFLLRDLIHILAQLKQSVVDQGQIEKNSREEVLSYIEQLQAIIDQSEHIFLMEDSNKEVNWIEVDVHGSKNTVQIYSEPTEIASFLGDDFFGAKKSIVLTSATLTMKNSYSFMLDRLGLEKEQVITKTIPSPFSYENQVQLLIPNDFPSIKHGNIDAFIYATCESILSLANITNGRMLVLFTSYEMLRKCYSLLREMMEIEDFMLIAQGISSGSRTRLKKNFQSFDKAILLGTSSFWEGVDIPGDDLSCLMIVRLPFQPPNHPIYEAKAENLKEQGKNAFMDLALPNAVIRFKQGFGRLIRSSSDRGIIFVCDARIIQARYGKYFTDSIPFVPTTFDTTGQLMEKATKWF
ncbi:ATP-dependent DNA helicase DinG [Oceanobacillus halotolerans]|uniref:ATP-dependent DNA helicase DinG n=1 Tax=Oceanobacillus halotolerans TaxID=2663380 RepID=UPI0013DB4EC5|nr:ATP-dependent DNA helicase DinG [Oceanobacillus halotolerans]